MTEVIYRVDTEGSRQSEPPGDAAAALERLLDGNRSFADLLGQSQVIHVAPDAVGISLDGEPITQRPFAAILGCSDARVPLELVFRCPSNAMFVVRVAGNVAGSECLGSLEYAVANLAESLRLVVVLGHTGCGAVIAAVDTYLDPRNYPDSLPLRAIVDRIMPAVRAADNALVEAHGGRTAESPGGRLALIETSVVLNAALAATTVETDLAFPVQFGVFDLESRKVTLSEPPPDADAMIALATKTANSELVRSMLSA